MADYLLDTNVIIGFLRGEAAKTTFLKQLVAGGDLLHSCEITVAEIFSGMREGEKEATETFMNSLRYLSTDETVARRGGEFRKGYRSRGRSLTLADALIAALSITHNLTLLTDNLKDYPMPELKKEKPLGIKP